MGGSATLGSIQLDFSVGEPVIQTASANDVTFTQGFHQPINRFSFFDVPFSVSHTVENTCVGLQSGAITISASGGQAPYRYFWNDMPNDSTTFSREGLGAAIYIVIVKDTLDNSDTLSLTVQETNECLKIYTGITANFDGANDTWVIGNIDLYENNKVQLYSRWGNLVWETTGYNNQSNNWGGQDKNNNRLPDGTYFYVILDAGSKPYKGWVELTGDMK